MTPFDPAVPQEPTDDECWAAIKATGIPVVVTSDHVIAIFRAGLAAGKAVDKTPIQQGSQVDKSQISQEEYDGHD